MKSVDNKKDIHNRNWNSNSNNNSIAWHRVDSSCTYTNPLIHCSGYTVIINYSSNRKRQTRWTNKEAQVITDSITRFNKRQSFSSRKRQQERQLLSGPLYSPYAVYSCIHRHIHVCRNKHRINKDPRRGYFHEVHQAQPNERLQPTTH